MLGDGGVIDSRGVEHVEFLRGGVGNINLVEADSVFADDFKSGSRFLDDSPGDGVVSAQEGVEVTSQVKHGGFREGAARPDNFEPL